MHSPNLNPYQSSFHEDSEGNGTTVLGDFTKRSGAKMIAAFTAISSFVVMSGVREVIDQISSSTREDVFQRIQGVLDAIDADLSDNQITVVLSAICAALSIDVATILAGKIRKLRGEDTAEAQKD